MKQFWLLVFAFVLCSSSPISDCACRHTRLFGRVKIVAYNADFKVKIVTYNADLEVQRVEHTAKKCGEWQLVEYNEDFTIQLVDYGEDFTIKYVDYNPHAN
ncbi:MAG: hypothetical protein NC038_05490 [Paludibacter sp.]|nr:hypothetical protein [Bacteroidales bacterium]MCM1069824.1 hypothetical protein [Prevotella sp.]MCM1353982.1 hypothetical protein [Bacteroides sp.]MCM1443376.1 hypothetical protein [Muribaculum sp.]MCM1482079.1 hypothetical protein [Paludibacter sp.]